MTALWIILGILALFALVLSQSATVTVEIGGEVRLFWGICFYRRRFGPGAPLAETPQKDKKKKRTKKKKKNREAEKKQETLAEEKVSEKTLGDTVELILLLVRSVLPGASDLLSRLRFTKMRIHMTVAGEEADQVAIRYGAAAAGVYNLLAVIDRACVLRLQSVRIVPDFVSGESLYDIRFQVKLRLAWVLFDGGRILFTLLKSVLQTRRGQGGKKPPEPVEKRRRAA